MPRRVVGKKKPKPFVAKDAGVRAAIAAIGDGANLARAIGITPAAVYRWDKVPIERLKKVERVTGISRRKLRPDLYY